MNCCVDMEKALDEGFVSETFDKGLCLSIDETFDEGDGYMAEHSEYMPIRFCPFCGKKVSRDQQQQD